MTHQKKKRWKLHNLFDFLFEVVFQEVIYSSILASTSNIVNKVIAHIFRMIEVLQTFLVLESLVLFTSLPAKLPLIFRKIGLVVKSNCGGWLGCHFSLLYTLRYLFIKTVLQLQKFFLLLQRTLQKRFPAGAILQAFK